MIPLKREPMDMWKERGGYEKCVFCNNTTGMWHTKTNNPVCPRCAKTHKVAELTNHVKNNQP